MPHQTPQHMGNLRHLRHLQHLQLARQAKNRAPCPDCVRARNSSLTVMGAVEANTRKDSE
jgi:hypothetical protein